MARRAGATARLALLGDAPKAGAPCPSLYRIQRPPCTALVAAHRLATVIHASRIAMMDKGRLIAVGNHRKLLDICPLYRQVAQLQRLHEKVEDGPELQKIRA
ncbi:MAG: hypothetical protein ACYDCW_00055 [Acidithiobacillus ferrivorans]